MTPEQALKFARDMNITVRDDRVVVWADFRHNKTKEHLIENIVEGDYVAAYTKLISRCALVCKANRPAVLADLNKFLDWCEEGNWQRHHGYWTNSREHIDREELIKRFCTEDIKGGQLPSKEV